MPRTKMWIKRVIIGGALIWSGLFPTAGRAQTPTFAGTEFGTPAYSYYLAVEVMLAYHDLYGIENTFRKNPLSHHLRPQHVYERALSLMDEFDLLFPGGIAPSDKAAVSAFDARQATPKEISAILALMRAELARQGATVAYDGPRVSQTPNEVYQILRNVGWYHREIATKRGLRTPWDSVERVYATVARALLPAVYASADRSGVTYAPYAFPMQPSRDVKPRNIYKLVIALYDSLMRDHARQDTDRAVVEFVEITDCDEITPADVFDLQQIVVAELKQIYPALAPSAQLIERFTQWRSAQDAPAPGHTFRLLEYCYLLMKRILGTER